MKTSNKIAIFVLLVCTAGSIWADLPDGWYTTQIPTSPPDGSVFPFSGSASYTNGTWTITSTSDGRGYYAYKHLSGNVQIIGRVLEVDMNAAAHLRIQGVLTSNSSFPEAEIGIGVAYQQDSTMVSPFFHWKISDTDYGSISDELISYDLPCWIRLDRRGDILTGYASYNGSPGSWRLIGSVNVTMGMDVCIGIEISFVGEILSKSSDYIDVDPVSALLDNITVESDTIGNEWMVLGNDMYSIPTGNVGIGTTNPMKKLHVSGGDILLDNNQYLSFINGSGYINKTLNMDNNDDLFLLNFSGGSIVFCTTETPGQATSRVAITNSGNVGIGTLSPQGELDVNGSIYQRGNRLHADYVFEPGYNLESIDEHSKFMWQNRHLKAIPKAKVDTDGQEIVEVGAHQRGIVEELEKAHIYIEQLNNRINVLEEKLAKLEAGLDTKQ